MPINQTIVYHILPEGGFWIIIRQNDGARSKLFKTKDIAERSLERHFREEEEVFFWSRRA